MSNFTDIQKFLEDRVDCLSRIRLIPYGASSETKENANGKYIYIRKRVASRLTSTYVGVYSDDLFQLLLRNARELRELKKQLRKIDKQLADLGYESTELSPRIIQNIDFARANMKSSIYDQAVLEEVATTFPQTEDILDNGSVISMTASDVQKILNRKLMCPNSRRKRIAYYEGEDISVLREFLNKNCWKSLGQKTSFHQFQRQEKSLDRLYFLM